MPSKDPTDPIRQKAVSFPEVVKGTACNQNSFKTSKGAFLFIGPGAKGAGFKAMFKLKESVPQARKLAEAEPDRYEVGSNIWVTTRFTAEKPLPKRVWEKWLQESYDLTCGGGARKKAVKKKAVKKKTTGKKVARKR